jgi:hypothetical protein
MAPQDDSDGYEDEDGQDAEDVKDDPATTALARYLDEKRTTDPEDIRYAGHDIFYYFYLRSLGVVAWDMKELKLLFQADDNVISQLGPRLFRP